jgi:hypothetical protein
LVVAGCSSHKSPGASGGSPSGGTETNPAGDIPDNQAFVPYTDPGHVFGVSVPEGWGQTSAGPAVLFTDKYNQIRIETKAAPSAPTSDSATATELPAISTSVTNYSHGSVKSVQRKAGSTVLIRYQDLSAPNSVTGKTVNEAVERYEFWQAGHEVILTLSSPVGSDNVDPWRTVTDSLRWLQ